MMVIDDEVQFFDSLFSLLEYTDDNEDKLVTLLDIKENLKGYSLSKLKSLASVLIDSLNEITKDSSKTVLGRSD